ncbi:MAG: nicotinate-nucleotide diphosphorylase (carboxylating) [Deltaproteobacteria bacterium]|nr:MAG: nicotinate-nucleotide diphosphorylase (carboxylating) [Deltaproteobacteria bacterium]
MDKNQLDKLIIHFLDEDIGRGDITSEAIFAQSQLGQASLVARETFVAVGMSAVAARVFKLQNSEIEVSQAAADGKKVEKGEVLLTVSGPVVDLLKAERVALNLVQRLSGIATLTARFVEQVRDLDVIITDTRKTTPGLRMLEKYAVICGGGSNHRYNLADGVLIKDNHIAACGSIKDAVNRVRGAVPHTVKIEVETENLAQVSECLDCGVDIIMLDNMSYDLMKEAAGLIDGRALVEASGGVNLQTVRKIAECGVDIISIGALTHSAPACDIGMDWQEKAG